MPRDFIGANGNRGAMAEVLGSEGWSLVGTMRRVGAL
jgi:hypothetical protein